MSVSTTDTLVQYEGNDSTVVAYPIPFPFFDEAWIKLELLDADGVATELTLGADYTVTGAGDPAGGDLLTNVAYDDTYQLTIYRVVPLTQLLDLVYNDRLPAAQLEQALDKLTFIVQQLAIFGSAGQRTLTFPISEPLAYTTTLPSPATRAGKFFYCNATTGEFELIDDAALAAILGETFRGETGPIGPTGPAFAPDIITEATTARTLALTDNGKYIRCTSGSTTTITIPVTGTGGGEVNWPTGAEIYIRRAGAGALALSIAGVTVNGSANISYVAQHQNLCLKHLGSSVWDLI